MNLNSNELPKGIVSLKEIFKSDDQAKGKGSNLTSWREDYTSITINDGRTLNLGKVCTKTKQEVFIKLCQEI